MSGGDALLIGLLAVGTATLLFMFGQHLYHVFFPTEQAARHAWSQRLWNEHCDHSFERTVQTGATKHGPFHTEPGSVTFQSQTQVVSKCCQCGREKVIFGYRGVD